MSSTTSSTIASTGASFAAQYLADALADFRKSKTLGEGAMNQLTDADLFRALDAEANSIAVIIKHLAGNFRSRWTNFLTTDGEKPDRDRDSEFVIDDHTTRADVMRWWEDGWEVVFDSLESLHPEDFARQVTIRGEVHTVVKAINRAMTHCAYHVGQIVFLAKHFRAAEGWQSLSIPREGSQTFNQTMQSRRKS